MRSSIGVDVAAPAELVFAIARDVSRWADVLPHYARSRVVARASDGSVVCAFTARRPIVGLLGLGIPVAWRSRCWSEAATDAGSARLRFVHVAGATSGMDVTWRIDSTPTGTRVSIEHVFERPLPLVGPNLFPRVVDRLFTVPIAGRTLAAFRAIAEATATVDAAPPQSDPITRANPVP
jgi:Polyketide cyclase / dehydrase and lipid transport